MLEDIIKAFTEAVMDTDKQAAFQVVQQAMESGITPEEVVFKVVIPAVEEMMSIITHDPDTNLAQHFMTGQIASEITEQMLNRFSIPPQSVGRVVIGTAHGDLHSLGKRIVSGCLKAHMVEVVDLGVNVTAEKFVEAAVVHDAQVIAISAMMTHTAIGANGCRRVRRLLREKGLESVIKLAVGGAPYRFDPQLYKRVEADGWAADGVTASKVIVDLIRQVKKP